jgi:chaperone required for assembly of F1-ATPase
MRENIIPEAMPFTKLAFTAVDRVAPNRDAVIDQIAAFANSDVVCYRASEPSDLVERQQKDWDPVLDWAREDLGASFQTADGIEFIVQDHEAIDAVTEEISGASDLFLTVLHTLAANSGSLLISLAVAKGRLEHSEAFRIANCDTLYQMEKWGADSEAQSRLDMLAAEFESATNFLKLLDD